MKRNPWAVVQDLGGIRGKDGGMEERMEEETEREKKVTKKREIRKKKSKNIETN